MINLALWKRLSVAALGVLALAQTGPDATSIRRMRADLEFLCSDSLEGRLSLARSADVAARYIAAEFERTGLDAPTGTGYFQAFPLVGYDPHPELTHLALLHEGARTDFKMGPDFRGGFWRKTALTVPVVFAGYGITAPEYSYDDYAAIDVHGKAVLVFDHEPQETDPHSVFNGTGHTRHGNIRAKLENAQRHGAVAVLLASEPLRKHRSLFEPTPIAPGSLRATAPRQAIDEDSIPLFQISDRVAAAFLASTHRTPAALAESIDQGPKPASQALPGTTVDLATAPENLKRGTSLNVVGLLKGSDPHLQSETIVINGHYDHLGVHDGRLYGGANDNASGTVAVMELARRLASASPRPRRSILFIVFGSEEEGLLGSYYYVEHPLRPLATTRAVLNLDMIARNEEHIPQSHGVLEISADTRNEINFVGLNYSPDLRDALMEANRKAGLEISTKFDRDHDLNTLYRCDHFPFLLHGVPAVWIFGGFHPGYHEPSDTVDRLNFPKLEKVVNLTERTATALAEAANPPRFQP